MLPVTRANLDHICSTCLADIRPSTFTRKVYDVREETELHKLLKLSAHITILKNPMNQSYIQEYCRKLCEICFLKAQFSFLQREKIVVATITVKELLENDEISDLDIEKLQTFCRVCLNRQHSTKGHYLSMEHLKWIKDCTGIRYTSLMENERFRLKEGTNLTELVLINDVQFPKKLCSNCLKKLGNMEEFRKLATQSFEYMISIMADVEKPPIISAVNFGKEIKMVQNEAVEKITNLDDVKDNIEHVPNEPIETINIIEKEISLQDEIKIEKEEFSYTEFKHAESENDFDAIYDVCADYSDDSNHNSYIQEEPLKKASSPSEQQEHKNIPSFDIDPIAEDEKPKKKKLRIKLARKTKSQNKRKNIEDIQDGNESTPLIDDESKGHVKGLNVANANSKSKRVKLSGKEDDFHCSDNESISSTSETNEKTKPIKRTRKAKQLKNTEKKQFKCEECTSGFSTQKFLDNHVLRKHRGVDQPFDCDKCSKKFRSIYVLRRHQKEIHSPKAEDGKEGDQEVANTCPFCSQIFKRKHHLHQHIKVVHEKIKPFKCSFCDKCFATTSIKRVHEYSHTDTFPFVCDWCARRFRRSSQLKIHMEVHTTKPEFLCPICKRGQKSAESLEEHLKNHDEKRLQCPSCGKLFKNKTHLVDHQNAVHLKLRPFKCEFCDLAFGDRKTRRVHEKGHTEDRPENCPVCKLGFKSRNTLGKHMKDTGHITEEYINNNKKGKKKSQLTNPVNVVNVHRVLGLNYLINEFSD